MMSKVVFVHYAFTLSSYVGSVSDLAMVVLFASLQMHMLLTWEPDI